MNVCIFAFHLFCTCVIFTFFVTCLIINTVNFNTNTGKNAEKITCTGQPCDVRIVHTHHSAVSRYRKWYVMYRLRFATNSSSHCFDRSDRWYYTPKVSNEETARNFSEELLSHRVETRLVVNISHRSNGGLETCLAVSGFLVLFFLVGLVLQQREYRHTATDSVRLLKKSRRRDANGEGHINLSETDETHQHYVRLFRTAPR